MSLPHVLTLRRDPDGSISLVGEAPAIVYFADELLNKADDDAMWVGGSNVLIKTDPMLRYVIIGRSTLPEHSGHAVWIAERVEEFPS